MLRKILAGAFTGLLLFGGVSYGADDTNVTVTTEKYYNKIYKEIVWFTTYDVGGSTGTAYDYNDAQGAGDTAGLVEARQFNLNKTIQIDVITLGSTSIDVRVEGRAGSGAEWGEIATVNFTATTGANNAHIINVVEFVEEIRVGVKGNTPGTDSVTISGILLGDRK